MNVLKGQRCVLYINNQAVNNVLRQITNMKMIVKLLPLLLLTTVNPSSCSMVIDSARQAGVYVSDYCPNMRFCREGTHVMCMYYDPNKEFGPRCINPVPKTTITADIAGQILDVVNTIRSKIAKGKEKGKDGVLLPRGYGIFRMHWDSELATFAQVTANQCSTKHDMCRATKRFPSPTQSSGMVLFSYPDWKTVAFKDDSIPNLTTAKLVYTVTQSLERWYGLKSQVTEDMLRVCPDFNTLSSIAYMYISMIQGPATHMGCGIAAYSNYFYQKSGIQNIIEVVCNFSEGLRKGAPAYEMSPPIPDTGYSRKCGCPPGSEEDADCLCNMAKPTPPPEPTCPFGENSGNDCESTLVLLPIFTMEDAPPDKLYQVDEKISFKDPLKNFILQRVDNTSTALGRHGNMGYAPPSMETLDSTHTKEPENNLWQQAHKPLLSQSHAPSYNKDRSEPQAAPVYRSIPDTQSPPPPPPPRRVPASRSSPRLRQILRPRFPPPPPPPPRIPPPPPPPSPTINLIKSLKHHEETRSTVSHDRRIRPLPKLPPRHRAFVKKASIFTRVAQFQLPGKRSMPSPPKVIKKDVAPRKDFSNLNKVVDEYLKRHLGYKIIDNNHEQNKPKEEERPRAEEKSQTQTEAVITDTGLNNAEETVINFNQYLSQKNMSSYNEKEVDIKDENDKKLLSLLDTLEQEVKHIALDGSEKEQFDAKIRKIYGSIVGKTALVKFPKPILLGTADQETPEIDFGETKSNDKLEPGEEDNHIEVPEESRQLKRYKVDKGVGRIKKYNPSIEGHIQGHKWKNKFIDSFDRRKDKENMDDWDRKSGDPFDHKYNRNLDHAYGDIDHKHMDEIDRKYKEKINDKYSENHLDQEYNDIQLKLSNNLHHQLQYNSVRKYDNEEPAAGSNMKYVADRDIYKEFEHNSRSSQEYTSPRNFRNKDLKATNHGISDIPLIIKDREKRKKSERKHRSRVKSLISHKDPTEALSLERRKYYQERLDNIKRRLRNRRNRGNNDPKNERSLRRMHTKNRETARTRTKSKADNFYMPEGAKFLHGF